MNHIITTILLSAAYLSPASVTGFSPPSITSQHPTRSTRSTSLSSEVATPEAGADTIQTDPKEAVKLFGRLAEKYISELTVLLYYTLHGFTSTAKVIMLAFGYFLYLIN